MFAHLGLTILFLVAGAPWVLPAAAGGANLQCPADIEVYIIDDTFTLSWTRSAESVGNVTFSAEYQGPVMYDWIKLPGCQYITSTKCDFSSLKKYAYEQIKLRVRAEEGNDTSPWCAPVSFIPYKQAHIGPPKVHLEAEDKAIILNISPPGTEDSVMWKMDRSNFKYNIVIWKNASSVKINEIASSRIIINDLSPETTYCLKVKAGLPLHIRTATYSPVYCINTTVENKLPPPKNIRVISKNQRYILTWNYAHENVVFQAQWLPAYFKKIPGDHSGRWTQIPNCENVRTTECVFPYDAKRGGIQKEIYSIRVRASSGNNTSFWSEEEELNMESLIIIPPPVITMKPINNNSLRVNVGFQNNSEYQQYPLTYEIIFWENTSNAERKVAEASTDFTFSNLNLLTVYCVKARALILDQAWNSSSNFSAPVCVRTRPGSSPRTWLIAGVCIILTVPVVLYVVSILLKLIRYVFFPSSKAPSTINECFSEQPLKNLLLSTSEEQTERCFIIEDTGTITTVEETNQIEDHKTYNSQTSQDSGNYSNEDENSGERTSEELRQARSCVTEQSMTPHPPISPPLLEPGLLASPSDCAEGCACWRKETSAGHRP